MVRRYQLYVQTIVSISLILVYTKLLLGRMSCSDRHIVMVNVSMFVSFAFLEVRLVESVGWPVPGKLHPLGVECESTWSSNQPFPLHR